MRGKTRRDWRRGQAAVHGPFLGGHAAMRWYDEQLEVGAVIESGTYEVWRVEQPSQVEGLGHAWAKLVAV